VLKSSTTDTNTSSQTFTPFTGGTFINNLSAAANVTRQSSLLQFADTMATLLSTAALFSRFYSQRIQT